MNKQEIKDIVEADQQLQWWAAVLFAEIADLVEVEKATNSLTQIYPMIKNKIREFEKQVLQRVIEKTRTKAIKEAGERL